MRYISKNLSIAVKLHTLKLEKIAVMSCNMHAISIFFNLDLVEINSNVQKPGRKSYISNADKKEKEVVGKFILEGRL